MTTDFRKSNKIFTEVSAANAPTSYGKYVHPMTNALVCNGPIFLAALGCLILGAGPSRADVIAAFEGQVDIARQQVSSVFYFPSADASANDQRGSADFQASKTSGNEYHFALNLERVKTPLCEVSSRLESSLECRRQQDGTESRRVHSPLTSAAPRVRRHTITLLLLRLSRRDLTTRCVLSM